jgi:hypothetical protein
VTEPGARADTEHALERYASLLAPTPRAMKRFIMSYSMLRAVRTAEGSVVGRGPLALWTILWNRWPVLADHLQCTLRPSHCSGSDRSTSVTRFLPRSFRCSPTLRTASRRS